jgi:PhnB protein
MGLVPYLTFNGNCEEALNFYKGALNGEIVNLSYFENSPMPVRDEWKKKVLNASLKSGDILFMASDSMPDRKPVEGDNISLALNFTDIPAMETCFGKLSQGGQVTMPLQDTFWGARFGMIRDRFGINWMMNCEIKK